MKNSTHKASAVSVSRTGMEFLGMGNGAWGMVQKLPMPNAQCPMPNAPSGGAAVPLHPQGDGVSRRFQ
ncbi:hypothetical protein H6G33_07880 [Calothrix sp. FACHB-1219]|uniref:hypothetical protein n=1 Tax=Calothrix sp. FACHB-1219 TaxID=2692778 RepID=UPI001688D8CA|nr:hypothetical protein [Calothrix sp. FACHB-1219]MBD2216947.1 hypothetical protein [Calothrix sp. FACHB-1219]